MARFGITLALFLALTFLDPLFGAGKQTRFTQRFQAGVDWSSATGEYRVRDFAFAIFNPNPTPIRLRATLSAIQNPAFIYFSRPGCVGDCSWDFIIEGYRPCLVHSGTLGSSGMYLLVALEPFWNEELELEVEALGSSADSPFYLFGPEDGFVTDSLGSDLVTTQMTGWQEFRNEASGLWDEDLGGWVVPFANSYQNHPDWPLGWKTTITIESGDSQGEDIIIRNHNQAISLTYHGHPGTAPATCCPEVATPSGRCATNHRFNTICQTVRVAGTQVLSADPYGFHIPADAISQNDGQLLILPESGNPGATRISVVIEANSVGSASSCPAEPAVQPGQQ